MLGVIVALVYLLRPIIQWMRTRRSQSSRLLCVALLFAVGGLAGVGHAAVLLEDDFEYVASRSDTTVSTVFTANGWTSAKAENNGNTGAGGYLYTQDDAQLGSKVLVMESVPSGEPGLQTDYYLKYGSDGSSAGTIPANVWFQFWWYGASGSDWTGGGQKLLYPCYQSYPCPAGTYRWIFGIREGLVGQPPGPAGSRYLQMTSPYANYSVAETGSETKMDQNLVTTPLGLGTWHLIKGHVDTSGAEGTYELWIRPRGTAAWTKYAEWIGGVTADFTWSIPEAARNGNIQLAIPTTVDTPDSTTYMDDFVMAESESDLPTYSDSATAGTAVATGKFVRFISSVGVWVLSLTAFMELCVMLCWAWAKREAMLTAILLWRYRRAVKRWHAQAPTMLDDASTTLVMDLDTRHQAWAHRGDVGSR